MSRVITKTRTGNIISDEELGLEYLFVGDYGKENNIKASFLGYDKRIERVEHRQVTLEDKLVVTVSSQKGCPMKCNFCDCPKLGFHGNVSKVGLISEITTAIALSEIKHGERLNVHFARMGEPTFNKSVIGAAVDIAKIIQDKDSDVTFKEYYPVVSTMMPKSNKNLKRFLHEWVKAGYEYGGEDGFGLQFSINTLDENDRDAREEYNMVTDSVNVSNRKSFNSANKFSAVETDGKEGKITYYKGAPEKLIDAAISYETAEGIQPIDKDRLKMIVKAYAVKAMRVIATGYSKSTLPEEGFPDDLILTSLVAIRDDVRPEVPEAVAKMHDAGVQVMMVTGDVIDTAKAIAKDAGLITSESDIAMSAIDFDALSDEEAKAKLPYIKVIARATPNTKLRIVRLAQELGLCVGMTGDGTNDAPALKAADVGFSMGSGTDVCKEAGDIIITDDNFVSITDAVLLGRTFMHNVMKFLKFQLPINVGLVILSILYPIIMAVEAVAAVQILVINIVMDSLNSLSFGGEPAKDEYMKEKPIPKGSKLLSKETIDQIAVSVVAFIGIFGITLLPPVQKIFGNDEAVYATVRFALLIMMATFNGFNIRTDGFNLFKGIGKNKLFIEIAVVIFALTFVLAQFGGDIMGCTAMTPTQWGVTVGLAFMIIPIDLVRKAIIKIKRK